MYQDKTFFETPPDIEALIMQFAEIKNFLKPFEAKANYLRKRIKDIAADIGCDVFVAERGGQMVSIAYLKDAPPKIDRDKLKYEYEEIYHQCLIQPGIEDRYLYTTDKAIKPETK